MSSLFVQRARELVRRPSVTCRPQSSVAEVARLLTREQVGSVVIVDDAGAPIGIVTDRDLRRKVVAEARDPVTTTAADIMSAPLVTVPADAFAFDALLTMTRQAIHHLAVVSDGALAGVLSTNDFVALEATHPAHLAREIARAPSVAALAAIGARTTALVRQLINAGITAYDIGQLMRLAE